MDEGRSGSDGGFDGIVDRKDLVHLGGFEHATDAGSHASERELKAAFLALTEGEDQAAQIQGREPGNLAEIDHDLGVDSLPNDFTKQVIECTTAFLGSTFGKGQDDRILHAPQLAEIQGDHLTPRRNRTA